MLWLKNAMEEIAVNNDAQRDDEKRWFEAAVAGDQKAIEQMLKLGIDVNAVDATTSTALHYATKHGRLTIMRLLIEHGADLHALNQRLSTPLHLTEKNIDAIRILLEAGADPNLKDADYDYPYYYAFYGSMPREIAELYIKHGANLMLFDK